MFQAMLEAIKEESVGFLFYVDVTVQEPEADTATEMAEVVEVQASGDVDVAPAAPVLAPAPQLATPRDALPKGLVAPPRPANLTYSAPSVDGGSHVERTDEPATAKVGRNDPCPCGSGKKYKQCHGAPNARTH
jgi:preprotein translocase subunit SecA